MEIEYEYKFPNSYDYKAAWRAMSFGRKIPEGYDLATAYLAAQRIWLDAIGKVIQGHPMIIRAAFNQSFIGPVKISGQTVEFRNFAEAALEAGVDYQMESFCEGVPLEYILGE